MVLGIVGVVVAGFGAWCGAGLWFKRGVEEPRFDVLSRDGDVEIRRYAPTLIAVTVVEGEREAALNEGFRRLAGYIFGKNRKKETIAMTAPVSATRSVKIAMTAPVSATTTGDGTYRVTFTMPSGSTLESLPDPDDERVKLEVVPARELAAVRFSGWAKTAAVERHTAELLAWAKRTGREVDGAPTLAQYDPPFTMPLMRRNEILLTLR